MSSISRFESDDISKEIKLDKNGVATFSLNGVAALCGITQQSLSEGLEANLQEKRSKLAEFLVGKGIQLTGKSQGKSFQLSEEATYEIINYYANHAGARRTDIARLALAGFGRWGIRGWAQSQLGYNAAPPQQTSVYIQRLQNSADHIVPDGYWTVFKESGSTMLLIEQKLKLQVAEYDLCDGSIGTRWGSYRKGQPWQMSSTKYLHNYRDARGSREVNAYDHGELRYFISWLRDVYEVQWLPVYLKTKYEVQALKQAYQRAGLLTGQCLKLIGESK